MRLHLLTQLPEMKVFLFSLVQLSLLHYHDMLNMPEVH